MEIRWSDTSGRYVLRDGDRVEWLGRSDAEAVERSVAISRYGCPVVLVYRDGEHERYRDGECVESSIHD